MRKLWKLIPSMRIQRQILPTIVIKDFPLIGRPWKQNPLMASSWKKVKSLCMSFPEKSVWSIQYPWILFRVERKPWKLIESIWKQPNWISTTKSSWKCVHWSRSHANCLHQGWKKNETHITHGNTRWTDFKQMQSMEFDILGGKSMELDRVDEKSMGNISSYQKARRTDFIHVWPLQFVNEQKTLKNDCIW